MHLYNGAFVVHPSFHAYSTRRFSDEIQLQMFSAGIPKVEDAQKFEVNEMPQLYECGETTSDKKWFGVGKRLNCAGLLKLRVTNGRYPQLIATLTDGRDPFNFMVDFDPSKKTQGYAALSFISALAGLVTTTHPTTKPASLDRRGQDSCLYQLLGAN